MPYPKDAPVLDDELAISRDNLPQRVSARLRELLIEGVLAPGAKLRERELCERLGVSRTPLREAVRLLAAEGLIVSLPGRGASVPVVSAEDVEHTFDVLAILEGRAAERAAAHITEEELARLRALQSEMHAAFDRRDLPTYYRLNARIHDLISVAAQNPVLRTVWQQLNARMHAMRFRSNQDEEKWSVALMEHASMVRLLEARDGDALRRLLMGHLHRKRDSVLEQMRAKA